MPEPQIKIGRIREASGDFARQHKEGWGPAKKNYIRRETEIMGVFRDLRIRYKTELPLKDTDDCEDVEFYGFCGDFEEK